MVDPHTSIGRSAVNSIENWPEVDQCTAFTCACSGNFGCTKCKLQGSCSHPLMTEFFAQLFPKKPSYNRSPVAQLVRAFDC